MGLCTPERARNTVKGAGIINALIAGYFLYIIQDEGFFLAFFYSELYPTFTHLAITAAGALLATLVLFCTSPSQSRLYSRFYQFIILILLVAALLQVPIQTFQKPDCVATPQAATYDQLLGKTGTGQYFCTPHCPCLLQEPDYLFKCELVITEQPAHRIVLNTDPGRPPVNSILKCPRFRPWPTYRRYLLLEQRYHCSGWCYNCNMQILNNSTLDIDAVFSAGDSCLMVTTMRVRELLKQFQVLITIFIVLLALALILEALKDHLYEPKKKDE